MIKLFKLIAFAVILSLSLTACDKDGDDTGDDITIFKATLVGSSEVPSNPSTATGSTTLTYDAGTMRFTAVTTYSGLTPTAGCGCRNEWTCGISICYSSFSDNITKWCVDSSTG